MSLQLLAFNGPLLAMRGVSVKPHAAEDAKSPYGLDPSLFGKHPQSGEVPATSLYVQAPSVVEVRLPSSLIAGAEFVATGRLHAASAVDAAYKCKC